MTNQPSTSEPESPVTDDLDHPPIQDSYVKLAMRNMVRKKGTSLKHFFLTVIGLLAFLIGISYLSR